MFPPPVLRLFNEPLFSTCPLTCMCTVTRDVHCDLFAAAVTNSVYTCTHNCTPMCLPLTIFQGRPSADSLMVCLATHCCLHISGRRFPVSCTLPCTFIFFLLNHKWINILDWFSPNPTGCFNLPRVLFQF